MIRRDRFTYDVLTAARQTLEAGRAEAERAFAVRVIIGLLPRLHEATRRDVVEDLLQLAALVPPIYVNVADLRSGLGTLVYEVEGVRERIEALRRARFEACGGRE